ncbi:uncharacterized protein SPPG_04287 [Spizellomyces punctatus DAOM BR117]|uniref:Mitochondrial glycine transporter n=1 Tax=Spizellomyces punctatus (strain DAOM BR117) TaxID=645134 RepID=A0A0L0HJB6_SPIPD|nr:uncharacterized protein SPPG_04287 [Spizellomyces punctatus DAOM BR117]KND01197.1 hypothetical protein SPPG_04287 [Spizellomyces punctatus DAOM BR117]|eukprot:XP_016609236.1 hypothetical protein SPPG_04287 [Spizellomyces punctatus DAOM BR117]
MTKKKQVEPHLHLLGGAVSGLAACVLLQPLDLVKTRLQQELHHRRTLISNAALTKLHDGTIFKDLTLWSTARDVIRKDSVWGLWRGTWPTVIRNVPGSALYFVTLDKMRHGLRSLRTREKGTMLNDSTVNLLSGGAARVAVGYILMPITVIKVRYESNFYNYTSIWQASRSILKEEGIGGLFRGFGATAMRDAPYAGLYVLFYENCKKILGGLTGGSASLMPVVHMSSGIVSGIAATVVTNPFDVVKTRMQLKPSDYSTMFQSARKIAREERAIGFFSGMLPRLLRKTVSSAITWTIYEEIVRWGSQRS